MSIKINFGGVYTTTEGKKYKLVGEATNYKQADKVYIFAQLDNNSTTGMIAVPENKLSNFTFQYNTY